MNNLKPHMKYLLTTTFVFSLLFGIVPAHADDVQQVDYDVTELEFPELNDFEIPTPKRIDLDNGLTVFLLENHTLPQVGALARIGVGSVWEPAKLTGLASITGTVMRTGGTETMNSEEINQALANVGASVETRIGGTSGSVYMSSLSDSVETVLPIFAGVIKSPAFAEEKVKLAKQQVKSGISRRNDNPRSVARREFGQLVQGEDSPYARVAQYYTIDRIQREDLVAFHDKYFHPNNTMISIWGDFDSEEMASRIRRLFGDWPKAQDFERPPLPPMTGKDGYSVSFIPKEDVTQSIVLMGHLGEIKRSNPDYFPIIVMNQVLSGGFTGRLFQVVRSDMGLAYSVYGRYSAGYENEGVFSAGVGTKSETTVEAAQAVMEQIKRMQTQPPSEEELQVAKDAFLNSFVFNFDSQREILSRLMTYEYYDYPRDFLKQIKEGVEQVSAEDVLRVSRKYLHPDRLDVLVLGNPEQITTPLANLAKDGDVQTIDISIPTQPPGQQEPAATKTELSEGQALLNKVKQALGGAAFETIDNFKATTDAVIQSAQGEQKISSQMLIAPPDKFNVQATLPTGMTVTIVSDGKQTMLKAAGRTMPVPAVMSKKTVAQLWRDSTYLMIRSDAVEAAAGGTTEVDGVTYKVLEISTPADTHFTWLINPDTGLPERVRYQALTRQGPAEAHSVLSDYREVAGVMVPFKVVSYRNGEQRGSGTMTSFDVNVELAAGVFEAGKP